MKRDPEVIRKLLIFFEEKKDDNLVEAKSINIDSHDPDTIQYHIDLMYEAGFLSYEPDPKGGSGNDFLGVHVRWFNLNSSLHSV